MARETITDLLYQYIRTVVHSGFRDGMLGGVREAIGLAPPEEESASERTPPTEIRNGDRAGNSTEATRTLPGISLRQLPNRVPGTASQPSGDGASGERRGRGRPRKYPSAPKPYDAHSEKTTDAGEVKS